MMSYSFQSVLCLIVLILLSGISRANDLPRDLRKIDQLTPLMAKDLVEQKKNLPSIKLPNLLSIDKQASDELAKFKGKLFLRLDCMSTLDSPTLLKKLLLQNGTPRLSEEIQKADTTVFLQTFKFKNLDKECASVLAKQKGFLDLSGLESLDKQVAVELSQYSGILDLSGLTSIDKNVAEVIARFECKELDLSGLDAVNKETKTELLKFQGPYLRLLGITPFDKELAEKITFWNRSCLRYNFEIIDKELAKKIADFKGDMISLGLTSINKDVAKELSKFQGSTLQLNALSVLDLEVAQSLLGFEGSIELLGLKTITIDTVLAIRKQGQAHVIINTKGMDLNAGVAPEIDSSDFITAPESLKSFYRENLIDRAQIKELNVKRHFADVSFNGYAEITGIDAKVIANFRGETLRFPDLKSMNTAVAKALSKFKGDELLFPSLSPGSLRLEQCRYLAEFEGKVLSFKPWDQLNTGFYRWRENLFGPGIITTPILTDNPKNYSFVTLMRVLGFQGNIKDGR